MVPSTRKISTSEGTMPQSTFAISARPRSVRASGGSAGTFAGCTIETARMKRANSATCRSDGPIAPRYMSPTETPSWSASTIRTSDGGITCVIVPEAAITPVPIRMS